MSRWPIVPLKGYISELSNRKGEIIKEILSVTNTDGFVRSLDVFDKQVFSKDPSNYKLVRFNDIAYNPSRINVGSVARCQFRDGGAVSPMYIVFQCRAELLPQFLLYFLKSDIGKQHIAHRCVGAVRFMLRFTDLEQIEFPLPPIFEQERIVGILDEANELCSIRTKIDKRISEIIEANFIEMFLGEQNSSWQKGTLVDFGVTIRYGLGQPPEIGTNGVAFVRATNVKRGRIVREGLIHVNRDKIPRRKDAFLRRGEVIIVRSGAYTGDVGFVDEDWEGAVAGYDIVLSPSSKIDGTFLTWFLMSKGVQEGYFAREKPRAGQPHLNARQVQQTPTFLPPITLQRAFSRRVNEVHKLQDVQALSQQRLSDLLQSLLQRAFQGEL